MLKKGLLILGVLLIVFVGVTYWSLSSTSKTFGSSKILGVNDLENTNFKDFDSVLISASLLYEANEVKNLMQGEQYRKAWEAPVKVPILFLDTLKGNIHILEEGGGHQTHSLKLETEDKTLITLRSVTKDPSPLIPKLAETLGIENIVVDGISAQHPYGALVVAELSNKANILNTKPQLVFLPKQDKLNDYNQKFGNRLFLLEYETKGNANWLNLLNVDSLVDTDDLQELKIESQYKVTIDTKALVRARLFDLLIGDWDRHAKQWGWALQKHNDSIMAIPLPCDRDNAFFNLEGILPTIISNNTFLPKVQSFEKEIDFLKGLVSPFDVYFMSDIPEEIFREEAIQLQQLLTDEAIESSFSIWPTEIFDLDGKQLIEKIKMRREAIVDYALKFKMILVNSDRLEEPLTGSENLKLTKAQLGCFNCSDD